MDNKKPLPVDLKNMKQGGVSSGVKALAAAATAAAAIIGLDKKGQANIDAQVNQYNKDKGTQAGHAITDHTNHTKTVAPNNQSNSFGAALEKGLQSVQKGRNKAPIN